MAEENTDLLELEKQLDVALDEVESVKVPARVEPNEAPPPRLEVVEEPAGEESAPPRQNAPTDSSPTEINDVPADKEVPPQRQSVPSEDVPPPRAGLPKDQTVVHADQSADDMPPPRVNLIEESVSQSDGLGNAPPWASSAKPETEQTAGLGTERPGSNQISKRKKREQDRQARV